MRWSSRFRVLPTLLAYLVGAWAEGCASSQTPLSVSIRVVEDTVLLRRHADGAFFGAQALVKNSGSLPVYVFGCGPSAERDIDGTWTTVFSPVCIHGTTWKVPPGDSTVVPVHFSDFTTLNMLPRLDPRAQPGRYRLVFGVTTADPSTGVTPPSSSVWRTASLPFILSH
jgi:hypothetical protein